MVAAEVAVMGAVMNVHVKTVKNASIEQSRAEFLWERLLPQRLILFPIILTRRRDSITARYAIMPSIRLKMTQSMAPAVPSMMTKTTKVLAALVRNFIRLSDLVGEVFFTDKVAELGEFAVPE